MESAKMTHNESEWKETSIKLFIKSQKETLRNFEVSSINIELENKNNNNYIHAAF